jgi:hypothetical protein
MRERVKIVSRLVRISISDDIRTLATSLPFEGTLEEVQEDGFAYSARGKIRVGARLLPVTVAVLASNSGVTAEVTSRPAGLRFKAGYGTSKDRKDYVEGVKEALRLCLN